MEGASGTVTLRARPEHGACIGRETTRGPRQLVIDARCSWTRAPGRRSRCRAARLRCCASNQRPSTRTAQRALGIGRDDGRPADGGGIVRAERDETRDRRPTAESAPDRRETDHDTTGALVEVFFGIITRQAIRAASSTAGTSAATRSWTRTADEILPPRHPSNNFRRATPAPRLGGLRGAAGRSGGYRDVPSPHPTPPHPDGTELHRAPGRD